MRRDAGSRSVLAVALTSVFGPLNSSMLAVALPEIRGEFDIGVGAVAFLVSSYLIAVAVCQPAGGRLGDAFGHIRVMKVGLIVLLVFSMASAFAWNFPILVALRSMQGVSVALIAPNATAYLRKTVEPGRLAGQLGFNGAVIGAGAALGPPLGGVLMTVGGWPWLFAVNLPLALLSFKLVLRLPVDDGAGRRSLQVDALSLGALLAWFTGITLVGASLRMGVPAVTAAAVALFAFGTAAYGLRYARTGRGVVDLRLFRNRNYGSMAASSALANLVMYTTLIAMPLYLRDIDGRADGFVGFALFVMSAAMVVVSLLGGRLTDSIGPRPVLLAGSSCLVIAAVGISAAIGEAPVVVVIGLLGLIGLGTGLLGAPHTSVALNSIPAAVAGSASGSFSMMRYVGSVLGAAVLAGVLGGDPSVSRFHLLFAILAVIAVVNLATAGAVRPAALRASQSQVVPEPTATGG